MTIGPVQAPDATSVRLSPRQSSSDPARTWSASSQPNSAVATAATARPDQGRARIATA